MVFINTDYIPSPTSSFLTVAGWIDEYGPLITIRSGTEKMVIIGRHKVSLFILACFISKLNILLQAAVDIMEKQGATLADRPRTIAVGEMLAGGLGIVSTPAGDRLHRMRRFVVRHMTQISFQHDAGYFIRIFNLKQLRHTSLCRFHSRNRWFSTFSMIRTTSTIMR